MGNLTHTVSGDIASFRSAARVPIESLKCHFKPKQDLHGYDRPWPAGGGKNLLDVASSTPHYTYYVLSEGAISISAVNSGNGAFQWFDLSFPAGTYTMSAKYSGSVSGVRFLCTEALTNWTWNDYYNGYFSSTNNTITFTASETFSVGVVFLTLSGHVGESGMIYDIQLELGSTATSYKPYKNICPIEGWNSCTTYRTGKNIGHIVGYSTYATNSPTDTNTITNSYGTTINTTNFNLPDTALTITLTSYPESSNIGHYKNGYYFIVINNLIFDLTYDISFHVSNITNNPLNATLSDLILINPFGSLYHPTVIEDNTIIYKNVLFKLRTDKPNSMGFDVRNCGMSFTMTEFMVTPTGMNNGIWEPYCGDIIPITFPTTGKNILNPADIILKSNFELVNGVYKNTNTDTRDSCLLAVQLWKTTGTYISTAITVANVPTGRFSTTFNVDNKECNYLCFKYNGKTRDFILLFPLPLSLRQYTISCDVLANDPTIVGGIQLTNILLEVGDTATAYESYRDDLDNTVYGGYVDIVKGKLVAEYKSYTFTGIPADGLTYIQDGTLNGKTRHQFRTNILDNIAKHSSTAQSYSDIASPNDWRLDRTNDYLFYIGTPQGQVSLYIINTACDATVESFNAWLSSHPWTIVFPLKDPIEYPLSKSELNTYLNRNNYWSNTNDITEVEYQIHDSNMIQLAKKNIMNENNTHYKKVLWNQWLPQLDSDNWQAYNSNYTTATFNNGIATNTWISEAAGYSSSIRNKTGTLLYDGLTWYASYMLNTATADLLWGIEMCGGRQIRSIVTSSTNNWILCSASTTYLRGTRNYTYICNLSSQDITHTGLVAQIKAPILINLTSMFGPGNEPTKEEFEYLCKINNVDLTEYHEYDEGTELIWYIPDHNINEYTNVNWNLLAKPINSDNYELYNSEAASVVFDNGVATRTILEETTNNNCFRTLIRTKYTFMPIVGHIYYAKEELNSEVNKLYVIAYDNYWHIKTITPNQWSIIEDIFTWNNSPSSGQSIYVCYRNNASEVGEVCSTRNPIFIDLTLMFGAGNEPTTAAELRARCLKNNINLDNPQPYNTGTKMIWKV